MTGVTQMGVAGMAAYGAGEPRESWRMRLRHWYRRKEAVANLAIVLMFALGTALYAWRGHPEVVPLDSAADRPPAGVLAAACSRHAAPKGSVAKVSDPTGIAATLSVYVGRGGAEQSGQSLALTVQSGSLQPGAYLCMSVSDIVRSDGQALPAGQVASWAQVAQDGEHLTVFVWVSPRYQQVSGFGGYTGTVSLNDQRAVGADIPVDIYVEYPYLDEAIGFALLASFGGFIWGRIVHNGTKGEGSAEDEQFWGSVVLRVAVILVTAIPVLSAQVLSNPDWVGGLSQYISLGTLAGGAAIAATPTLSAIVDRYQDRARRPRQPGADGR